MKLEYLEFCCFLLGITVNNLFVILYYHYISILFVLFISFVKENLALNRLTWQQNPWLDTNKDVGSENAVDGLYYDRGTGGQCAISADNKSTSEWGVDLGNVASISHIDIFYRTDNQPSSDAYPGINDFKQIQTILIYNGYRFFKFKFKVKNHKILLTNAH